MKTILKPRRKPCIIDLPRGQTTRDYLLLDDWVSREEGSWRV
jgi:hypothetical protein